MRRLALAIVSLAAVAAGAGAGAAAPPAGASARIDVVVEGVAERVSLTAADFRVSEGGQPVAVARATRADIVTPATAPAADPGTDPEDEAARTAPRLVGIYVDEYHLDDTPAFAAARARLARFVRDDLGPTDRVVVLKPLDSLLAIHLTGDRDAAANVIEQATPRLGDYTPRSDFEQNFIAGTPARIDAARTQIGQSAIGALITHLGRIGAGRATLIVMSNGFAVDSRSSAREQMATGTGPLARLANRARVALYLVQPSEPPARVQTVAADGGRSAPPRQALAALAADTTGLVMTGAAAIDAGLTRVAREARTYYVLELAPDDRSPDGRYRVVSVTVQRPGARVRARSGFLLPRPPQPEPKRAGLPDGLKVPRRTSALIRTWFGQSAGDAGATTVAFVWEPAPRLAGDPGPAASASQVTLRVTTLEGASVFSGTSAASGGEPLAAAGQVPELSFDTTPGQFLVQMEVLDPAGRIVDRDVRDLIVRGFPDALAFGTAAVFRARTLPALRAIVDGRSGAAPVAARQFSRAEQLLVRVPIVSRDGEAPVVAARLESRFGTRLRDVPLRFARPSLVEAQLPLAGLASGGYVLAFDAQGRSGTAQSRLEFVVTP